MSNIWNNRFPQIIAFSRIVASFWWEKINNHSRLLFEGKWYQCFGGTSAKLERREKGLRVGILYHPITDHKISGIWSILLLPLQSVCKLEQNLLKGMHTWKSPHLQWGHRVLKWSRSLNSLSQIFSLCTYRSWDSRISSVIFIYFTSILNSFW